MGYQFQEVHWVDAVVFYCLDPRFQWVISQEFERQWLKDYDAYVLPGGPKNLLEEGIGPKLLKKLISVSVELHQARRVILIAHRDCGAYGGSKAFSSPAEERKRQEDDLRRAKNLILGKIPQLRVEMLYLEIVQPERCDFELVNDENNETIELAV